MNNRKRTANIIRDFLGDKEPHATILRNRLDNAGLITQDLPNPREHGGKPTWPIPNTEGWTVSQHDGWVRIADNHGAVFDVDMKLGHDLGLALLAATKDTNND